MIILRQRKHQRAISLITFDSSLSAKENECLQVALVLSFLWLFGTKWKPRSLIVATVSGDGHSFLRRGQSDWGGHWKQRIANVKSPKNMSRFDAVIVSFIAGPWTFKCLRTVFVYILSIQGILTISATPGRSLTLAPERHL